MVRRLIPLAVWVAGLVGVLMAVGALGDGSLAPPDLRHPSTWGEWADRREPMEAVFAVLRLVVLGLAWYLLGATAVGLAGRVLRASRFVAAADFLTVPSVRRILQAAFGVGLATAALASVRPDTPPALPAAVTLAASEGAAAGSEVMHRLEEEPPATATMHRLAGGGAVATTWTVARGEHFWSIAEQVLAQAWARPATDAEVVPYWQALIEKNRHLLVDPGNADLIFPGQVFQVPPPPG